MLASGSTYDPALRAGSTEPEISNPSVPPRKNYKRACRKVRSPPATKPRTAEDADSYFRNFAERMLNKYGDGSAELAAQRLAEAAKKMGNEARISDPEKLK